MAARLLVLVVVVVVGVVDLVYGYGVSSSLGGLVLTTGLVQVPFSELADLREKDNDWTWQKSVTVNPSWLKSFEQILILLVAFVRIWLIVEAHCRNHHPNEYHPPRRLYSNSNRWDVWSGDENDVRRATCLARHLLILALEVPWPLPCACKVAYKRPVPATHST